MRPYSWPASRLMGRAPVGSAYRGLPVCLAMMLGSARACGLSPGLNLESLPAPGRPRGGLLMRLPKFGTRSACPVPSAAASAPIESHWPCISSPIRAVNCIVSNGPARLDGAAGALIKVDVLLGSSASGRALPIEGRDRVVNRVRGRRCLSAGGASNGRSARRAASAVYRGFGNVLTHFGSRTASLNINRSLKLHLAAEISIWFVDSFCS